MVSLTLGQLSSILIALVPSATSNLSDAFSMPPNNVKSTHYHIISTSVSVVHRRHQLQPTTPLSMTTNHQPSIEETKTIYDIPNSGWSSNAWNWGSAIGTGHDCAMICRRRWSSRKDREALVSSLLNPQAAKVEVPFEEVKLILGLVWQNGRWDGSDGGPNGYAEVLSTMAAARRYEVKDNEVLSALNFIEDVRDHYYTISRSKEDLDHMKSVAHEVTQYHHHMVGSEDVFRVRRVCAGMVLNAMNFVGKGI
ncbi:predicted protein [Thalassiosira pseudonana CCMP1335]|uniref:Uncharacterized protein n=1 Tax=Thalassiosira pseudonana TaxID=35128 RepID=B8BTL8_THAPS|nr:predicted protein [Thalassiosira pseudonana CCMP1335]EED95118.1 predicted protein [Thalassiosira pseudonana CCMP1335]